MQEEKDMRMKLTVELHYSFIFTRFLPCIWSRKHIFNKSSKWGNYMVSSMLNQICFRTCVESPLEHNSFLMSCE